MVQTEREYAQALYALASEQGAAESYLASLEVVCRLMEENPEYTELLSSPAIPLSHRLACLDEAFAESVPEYLLSFLKLLCENGRICLLPQCMQEFAGFVRVNSGRTVATITSAVPLKEEQKVRLLEKLQAQLQKGIDPIYIVDAALLGGIKVEADGKILDGTVKHRLSQMKDVMKA